MSSKARKLRETRNRSPDKSWVWLTREVLESDAWKSLSRQAFLVISRVMIEHMAHAGTENGNLAVRYADFVKFGAREKSLKAAIAEAAAKGLLLITEMGQPSAGPDRWPTRFALGWMSLYDGTAAPNRWKTWRAHPTPSSARYTTLI